MDVLVATNAVEMVTTLSSDEGLSFMEMIGILPIGILAVGMFFRELRNGG